MRVGIAFRPELASWLATCPGEVACLELSVDQALGEARQLWASRMLAWPTVLHARQLALGTPPPLDSAHLDRVLRAVRVAEPIWIAAYLGCRHRPEAEVAYPQPVTRSRPALGHAVENCRQLLQACGRPVLIETVAAFGNPDGAVSPADFVNQLCDQTGCRVLLDVTALTLDSRFGFDPRRWLWDLDPSHVIAMHLGGWAPQGGGRWAGRHEGRVSEDTWALAREVAARTPVRTAILQRDGWYPGMTELRRELHRLESLDLAPALPETRTGRVVAAV